MEKEETLIDFVTRCYEISKEKAEHFKREKMESAYLTSEAMSFAYSNVVKKLSEQQTLTKETFMKSAEVEAERLYPIHTTEEIITKKGDDFIDAVKSGAINPVFIQVAQWSYEQLTK